MPGSFSASTATGLGFGPADWWGAIAPTTFPNGDPLAYRFDGAAPGSLVNFGALTVGTGASLTLLGGNVLNFGSLVAPGGEVTLGAIAGDSVARLGRVDGLLTLEVSPIAVADRWTGTGAIAPLALPELLTGAGLEQATHFSVTPTGQVILTASGVAVPDGSGAAIATGEIDVSRSDSGATVPQVGIFGDRVGLFGAAIAATAPEAGGMVRVGGGFQGADPVPNSLVTIVDRASTVDVSAIGVGDGGQAIVWADDTTRFYGTAIARGGANGGNGGLIETSGKRFLDVAGSAIDASATNGLPGTWLLDPTDITISSDPTTNATATANINNAQLAAALDSGTSVTISTFSTGSGNGDITVNAPISWLAATTLTLNADRDITTNASIGEAGIQNYPRINFVADGTIEINADIFVGDIAMTAGQDIIVHGDRIEVRNGNLNFTANDAINISANISADLGDIAMTAGQGIIVDDSIRTNGGSLNFNTANAINIINANIYSFGDLAMTAGQNITISGDLVAASQGNLNLTTEGAINIRLNDLPVTPDLTEKSNIYAFRDLAMTAGQGITVNGGSFSAFTGNSNFTADGAININNVGILFLGGDLAMTAGQGISVDSDYIEVTNGSLNLNAGGAITIRIGDMIANGDCQGAGICARDNITIEGNLGVSSSGPILSLEGALDIISAAGDIEIGGMIANGDCQGAGICAQGDIAIEADSTISAGPVFALGGTLDITSTTGSIEIG
ncbi:MAG: hypothetical protein Fur0042_31070 [Cyanophyceae cyanobacterium]